MIRWEYCRTYDIAGFQLHSMVVKQQQWWQRRTSTWQQCCQWTVHTDVHCAIAATLTQRRHSVYRHCCYAETDEKTTTWQRHWAVLSFQEVSSVICGIQLSIHSQFSFNIHTRQTYLNCQSKCHYFFGSHVIFCHIKNSSFVCWCNLQAQQCWWSVLCYGGNLLPEVCLKQLALLEWTVFGPRSSVAVN